jgi:glyoxylase-like metal-dependent hydrolase (beta-lactamase superfamily II)
MMIQVFFTLLSTLLAVTALSCNHDAERNEIFAPVPATANGDNTTQFGWQLEDFGGGVYMVTDGIYQSLFVVSTHGVILVDAPPTLGKMIGYAISNVTNIPITHFIYSHSHSDHVGGAYLYASQTKDTQIIGHTLTKQKLAEVPDPERRPFPTKVFDDNYTLHVGNQTLELSYKGENHELGNIFVYSPAQKVLMLVDVVFPGWVPFAQLADSTNIPGWIQAHHQILEYDFIHYIGGHVGRSGSRNDVQTQLEYVSDLFNNCNASLQLTMTNNPILGASALLGPVSQLNPGNYWAQFKIFSDIVAEYCANTTNEKWLGKLGGADVYGFENAYTMMNSLRLDWDLLGLFGVKQ